MVRVKKEALAAFCFAFVVLRIEQLRTPHPTAIKPGRWPGSALYSWSSLF